MAQPVRLRARIAEVETHAPDVRSYTLVPERPVPRFRPGQFLHLAIDPFDPSQHWPDSRVFSIASSPEERQRLRVTVSAVGKFTKRMMELKHGDEVWVKLPYGDFVIQAEDAGPVILIAGGTGITPFVSFLAGPPVAVPVRVLYGAKRSDLLIYRKVLDHAAQQSSTFAWQAHVEESPAGGEIPGRLSVEAALRTAQGTGAAAPETYYISGPPVMLALFRTGLAAAGVAAERIRTDAWD
jgi:ferredoxin-NADP reductase